MNINQCNRYLARKGVQFSTGKGDHLIATLNGKRAVIPEHGGSKAFGEKLWQAILKQLNIKE